MSEDPDLKKLKRKVEREPESRELLFQLALAHYERQEYADAISSLNSVMADHEDSLEFHLLLGGSYLANGEPWQAEKSLRNATVIDPSDYRTFFNLAHTYIRMGKLDHAKQCLKQAGLLSEDNAEIHNDLGVLLYNQGKLDDAVAALTRSLEINPSYVDAQLNLGLLYFEDSEYEKAIPCFEKVVDHEPAGENFLNLGLARVRSGKIVDGIDALRRALEMAPENPDILTALSESLRAVGELSEAIETVRKAGEIEGITPRVASCLAECYLAEGRVQEAKDILASRTALDSPGKESPKVSRPHLSAASRIVPFEMLERARPPVEAEEKIEISVVIPILNEGGNIDPLYEKLVETLSALDKPFEIIFVDDGSTDHSLERLEDLNRRDGRVIVISFRKNYGQTAALSAGFDYAQGEVIISMDGDLQNDPRDIPLLLKKMAEGYDLVNGWRKDRKDNTLSRLLPSFIANRLIAKITGVKLNDYGCTLKAYKRGVIKNIRLYGEMHRFIPAIVSWLGARTTEIPVQHHPRVYGETKYNIGRTVRVILDLINVKFLSSYLTRPMQYFGKFGVYVILLGLAALALTGVLLWVVGLEFNPNLAVLGSILFVGLGVQFMSIGLIAEIIIRTYHEGQDRPIYVVKEILD